MQQGSKIRGAGSNAARCRCPAAPSDMPKSGGAAAPPASHLAACLNKESRLLYTRKLTQVEICGQKYKSQLVSLRSNGKEQ